MIELTKTKEKYKNLDFDIYTMESRSFRIQINHWSHWDIFIYVYRNNKLFPQLKNCGKFNRAKINKLCPFLHGNCTYFSRIEPIKIGCEYYNFTSAYSKQSDLPDEIRIDAEHLYNHFKKFEE